MKLIASISRWMKAKDADASEKIERGQEVEFAKQDMEKMKKDLAVITSNVGTIKSTITRLRRELTEMQREKEKREKDAVALLEAGNEELAKRHAVRIEALETSIQTTEAAIDQQEGMLATQQAQRKKYMDTVGEAENSLRLMESMDAVAKSTEKITAIKVEGTSNALASFKERQKRIQQRLDKASAIQEIAEEESGDALEKETEAALGRTAGSATLERLRAIASSKEQKTA